MKNRKDSKIPRKNYFISLFLQEDIFNIEAADLGYVRKVTIRHDNSNLGSDWYLDRLEIEAVAEGRRFVFPCERWLAKKKDDGKIKRTIYEKSYTVSATNLSTCFILTTVTLYYAGI